MQGIELQEKKHKKIKAYIKSRLKEPTFNKRPLILDLHTPKLEQLNHQMAFCI